MTYPITHIEGLGADEIKKLKSVRIRTTERLLEAAKSPKGRKLLADQTGIGENRLLDYANAADHLRIKGLGGRYVGLLRAVGLGADLDSEALIESIYRAREAGSLDLKMPE